jgi:hypothetical protein
MKSNPGKLSGRKDINMACICSSISWKDHLLSLTWQSPTNIPPKHKYLLPQETPIVSQGKSKKTLVIAIQLFICLLPSIGLCACPKDLLESKPMVPENVTLFRIRIFNRGDQVNMKFSCWTLIQMTVFLERREIWIQRYKENKCEDGSRGQDHDPANHMKLGKWCGADSPLYLLRRN